jgi:exopolysaccharide production protein ExoQ
MESKSQKDAENPIRWFAVVMLAAAVVGGITMAAGTWDASLISLQQEFDYDFKDNTLATQRAGLNKWLIVGYSLFAVVGVIGCMFGEARKMSLLKFWVLFPIAFWLWCGLSFVWSVELGLSVRRVGHLFMTLAGGFGISTLLRRREVIWMAILSMFFLTAVGVLVELKLGTFNPWRSGYRFCGIGHANETGLVAAVLCLAARVAVAVEDADERRNHLLSLRNIAAMVFVYGLGIVIITKSRTTLASLVVALVLVQLTMSNMRNAMAFLASGASLASIVGLVVAMASSSTSGALFGVAAIGRSSDVGSLTGRMPLWEEILKWVERKPILGFGYGGYWTTKRVEDFAQMFYWEPPNGHSIYIDAMVEVGLIGFVLLVGALLATNFASLVTYFKNRDSSHLFVIGILNLAVIHGLTESSFLKGCFGPLWFAIAVFTLLRARYEIEAEVDLEADDDLGAMDKTLSAEMDCRRLSVWP